MNKLKAWRKKNGVSRMKLALLLGKHLPSTPSPTSIQAWEEGKTEPRASTAVAIEQITQGKVPVDTW